MNRLIGHFDEFIAKCIIIAKSKFSAFINPQRNKYLFFLLPTTVIPDVTTRLETKNPLKNIQLIFCCKNENQFQLHGF